MSERVEVEILIFQCDDRFFGLRTTSVGEVLRAVALSHVPQTPESVMGIVNCRGRALPVLDTKRLLGLGRSEVRHTDQLIVIDTKELKCGLQVDRAVGLTTVKPDHIDDDDQPESSTRFIDLIAKTQHGIVQVIDPEKLLSSTTIRDLVRIVASTTATESTN